MARDPSQHNNRNIQYEQKILHYKSEVAHYQSKMSELEQQLQKEKTRIHYLQTKLSDVQKQQVNRYEKKIAQLEDQLMKLEVALEEEKNQTSTLIKEAAKELNESQKHLVPSFQAYFSHSIILPSEDETDVSIIGDFTIVNIGSVPLHNLILLLRLSPKDAGKLSGKIMMNTKKEIDAFRDSSFLQWKFVHDNWMEKVNEHGEYWLKPFQFTKLTPGETISFPNFELRVQRTNNSPHFILNGFIYCNEIKEGKKSLNQIIINF